MKTGVKSLKSDLQSDNSEFWMEMVIICGNSVLTVTSVKSNIGGWTKVLNAAAISEHKLYYKKQNCKKWQVSAVKTICLQ